MTKLLTSDPSFAGPRIHFGDQQVVDNAPGVFPDISTSIAGQDDDNWNLLQWSQQELLDPNAVTLDAPGSYDATLGKTASYSWSTPDGETALNAYNTTAGGWVYDLASAGTTSDNTEHDVFLSTAGDLAVNFGGNEVDFSMNTRVISESISRVSTDADPTFAGAIIGFTLNYNLPGQPDYDPNQPTFATFLQIPVSSTQNNSALLSYFDEEKTASGQPSEIITDQLRHENTLLPTSGSPTTAQSYDVTAYVADISNYLAQQESLGIGVTDLARWTLTGAYTGVMTAGLGAVANVQFSDIELTSGNAPSTAPVELNPLAFLSISATTFSNLSADARPYAEVLAGIIGTGLSNGQLVALQYTSGGTAPAMSSGTSGVALIESTPTTSVAIPITDGGVVITAAGATSITGGAAGATVVAGNGGLTYTNITPSGPGVTYIAAGDGPNWISTTPGTTGNYQINTGAGNDTISVDGNAQINAGTGYNAVSVTGGASFIYSEGFDVITGSTVARGAGFDSVSIGAGQTTINPGMSNLFVFGNAVNTNPLIINGGTGSDVISTGSGGGIIVAGSGGNSILFGGIAGASTQSTQLFGTADGDELFAIGGGSISATAGAGIETITGAGGSPNNYWVPASIGNNTFKAGSGNDTLIAGQGRDTLIGGTGTAAMISGTAPDTFEFQFGNGGSDTITGFKATDTLQLNGYGIPTLAPSLVGGNTLISLSDGTTLSLTDVSSINPTQILFK